MDVEHQSGPSSHAYERIRYFRGFGDRHNVFIWPLIEQETVDERTTFKLPEFWISQFFNVDLPFTYRSLALGYR